MGLKYKLPEEVRDLVHARNRLRQRFDKYSLRFTLDGNLVGDLGEAIAAELFGLKLVGTAAHKGIDARDLEGRTVQIKATGRGKTFSFTHTDAAAERLLALVLDYELEEVEVVYDGSYKAAIGALPESWFGQKTVTVNRLRSLSDHLLENSR